MFGKKQKQDLVDDLGHELERARARRDALASDVTTLAVRIAELEARLSQEKDRRERERVAGEIEEIKKRLEDTAGTFASVIARLCEATAAAASALPEARELNGLLAMVATEVDDDIDSLLCALRRRAESVRAGEPEPCPSAAGAPAPRRVNERLPLLLPAFLPRTREVQSIDAAEELSSTAA